MRCELIERAKERLADHTVTRVIGWQRGDFAYDVTPAVFASAEELERDFVYDPFCGANLSKYLIKESLRGEGRILAFLKPCDTFSLNQLLTEHRVKREAVYVVGIPCRGKADFRKLKDLGIEGVSSIREEDGFVVETSDGEIRVERESILEDRCLACKSGRHVLADELIGDEGEDYGDDERFEGVKRLEGMSAEERFSFWHGELSRCIRCNACRNVCPACTCETCVFDNPASGVAGKASADSFEDSLYHIIRAYHVAGRCTDCGECSRVCPERIPLYLLNRKFIRDIDAFYGEYRAGERAGQRNPLVDYREDDPDPNIVRERGNER